MKRALIGLMALGLLAAGCSGGGHEYSGSASDPVATYGECAFCHNGQATRLASNGGHGDLDVKCELCHEDLTPGAVGPGHRSIPACAECHADQMTHHDPAAGTDGQCLNCHTPHGSPNLFLVRTAITTPSGDRRNVEFTTVTGHADGGFTSASDPGSGLCEVCHTETQFYRSDGTGDPHFTFTCFTCHPHSNAFSPD
jgi:predicted CXXCH cytochrome family protein